MVVAAAVVDVVAAADSAVVVGSFDVPVVVEPVDATAVVAAAGVSSGSSLHAAPIRARTVAVATIDARGGGRGDGRAVSSSWSWVPSVGGLVQPGDAIDGIGIGAADDREPPEQRHPETKLIGRERAERLLQPAHARQGRG